MARIKGFRVGDELHFHFHTGGAAPTPGGTDPVNAALFSESAGNSIIAFATQEGWYYSQDNNNDAKTTTTQSIVVGNNTYLIAAVMYRGDSVSIPEEGWEKIVDSEVADPSGPKQKIAVYGRQATEGRYTVTVTQSSSARMGLKLIALAGASGVSVINNILIPTLPYTAPVSTGKRRLYLASSTYANTNPTEPTTIKTTDDNLLKAEELRFTAFYDSRKNAGNISEFITNLSDYSANTINFITLDITEV